MYFGLLNKEEMIMKLPMIAGAIVFAFSAEGAMAACSTPATQVTDGALTTLLSGNTVCAMRGGDRWQEEHHAGGVLIDYKKGPTDAVDPTKQVGTWAVSGTGAGTTVTYNYTVGSVPGPSYNYAVWQNTTPNSYSFCKAGAILDMDFTLTAGTGSGCP